VHNNVMTFSKEGLLQASEDAPWVSMRTGRLLLLWAGAAHVWGPTATSGAAAVTVA
jgi:hypothetical protein